MATWQAPTRWSWLEFEPPVQTMQRAWQLGIQQEAVAQREREGRREAEARSEQLKLQKQTLLENQRQFDLKLQQEQDELRQVAEALSNYTSYVNQGKDTSEQRVRSIDWQGNNSLVMADPKIRIPINQLDGAIGDRFALEQAALKRAADVRARTSAGKRELAAMAVFDDVSVTLEEHANFVRLNDGRDGLPLTPSAIEYAGTIQKRLKDEDLKKQEALLLQRWGMSDIRLAQRNAQLWRSKADSLKSSALTPTIDTAYRQALAQAEAWEAFLRGQPSTVPLEQPAEPESETGTKESDATPPPLPATGSGEPVMRFKKDPQTGRAIQY